MNDLLKKIIEATDEETRNYKIIGSKETLDNIERFLRYCEYLGNVGSSRTLKFEADGDGNFRPKIKGIHKENEEAINNLCSDMKQGKSEIWVR
jgi:hypothetical protein